MTDTLTFDVLIATDLRFPGGNTSSIVEEIHAQSRAGYRTGLLHLPSPMLTRPRPFAPKIRNVLDQGLADLVVAPGNVSAGLLLIRHPSVFTDPPSWLPSLDVDQVLLAVNHMPADARSNQPYYDVPQVHRNIERLTGVSATWAPIGPTIRQALVSHTRGVPMLDWDWENVIDVDEWRTERTGFVSDRPVIGRHSRGDWSKWPGNRTDILAAYPDDPQYTVRILGGLEAPTRTLGSIPANWEDWPFNSVPAADFLRDIDFFVYFHNSQWRETFGRVTLEALASGAVAVVPRYMEDLFGDACLYAEPAEVRGIVERLYADWDAYSSASRAGVELVEQRFSYETHIRRLESLIGEPTPSGATASPSATQLPQRGTLVIDVASADRPDTLLPAVRRETSDEAGPRVVAQPAQLAAHDLGDLSVETFPRVLAELLPERRRQYFDVRISGMIKAHRPQRLIFVDDGSSGVDLTAHAAHPGVTTWLVHTDDSADAPAEAAADETVAHIAYVLPPGWRIDHVAPPVKPSPPAQPSFPDRLRRAGRKAAAGAVRRVRAGLFAWLRRHAKARHIMLFETAETDVDLPVSGPPGHPRPETLPVSLLVAPTLHGSPDASIRAIMQRQQVTGGFRVALLAPPDWEPVAAEYGLTIETLIPELSWRSLYGSGWSSYVRHRIDETCRVVGPETVVMLDDAITSESPVLDALESAHVRRRLNANDGKADR